MKADIISKERMVNMENRTLEDFVEDLITDGRSLNQILIVAFNSRWRSHEEEIKKMYRKLRD